MSTYPVFTAPFNNYSGRSGVEIKNAGKYQRFAMLATGNYRLTNSTQTYTDMIVRDFADQ
jgi:maltoporin